MRIAMLGQYPLNEQHIVGGVEAVMVPLLHGLTRFEDLEVHVVTCQPGVEDQLRTTRSGWPLHILQRRRLGRLTFHAKDVSSIGRAVRNLSPDLVHAQGMGIYAGAAAHSPYPHVVTPHGIFFREAEFATGLAARARGFMDGLYEKYYLTKVKNLVSISPYVEEELVRRGFQGRVYRIENPVDDMLFAVHGGTEEATILYAGRVISRKGLLDLLCALVEVQKILPKIHLRVAGETESDPAYLEACRQFITQQALGTAVTFLGSLTMEQMVKEYTRCAVLALPSKQETAPVVVAEAMAAGRPVVATRVCGVPYMVQDGVSGLLVDYGDVVGLADALLRVLCDKQLRIQMGQRGREVAEARFRTDVVASRTRELYLQLVS